MNATCEWLEMSAVPFAKTLAADYAFAWKESLEFRILNFIVILLLCVMCWVTSLVKEVVRAATTVLCTLQASGNVASAVPDNRNKRIYAAASSTRTVHKTDGGPPPGDPPSLSGVS